MSRQLVQVGVIQYSPYCQSCRHTQRFVTNFACAMFLLVILVQYLQVNANSALQDLYIAYALTVALKYSMQHVTRSKAAGQLCIS